MHFQIKLLKIIMIAGSFFLSCVYSLSQKVGVFEGHNDIGKILAGRVLSTHHHGHPIAGKLLSLGIPVFKNNCTKKD
jgi:hypothetical protein